MIVSVGINNCFKKEEKSKKGLKTQLAILLIILPFFRWMEVISF